MPKPPVTRNAVRDLLQLHSDGLTLADIVQKTDGEYTTIYEAVKRMHQKEIYIDRWIKLGKDSKTWKPVYCLIDIPEDCPPPTEDSNATREK